MRPLGRPDIVRLFGDPVPHIGPDGLIMRSWEQSILDSAELPAPLPLSWNRAVEVRRFKCHRLLVPHFEAALKRIFQSPEAWASIGDFGGCYAYRAQRGTRDTLSTHCWGIAIDLDVADNPMGGAPRVHERTIESFEMEGFLWGGRFAGKRRDPMHFEFADPSKLGSGI